MSLNLLKKTALSFERVDGMSSDLRECVHEFGEPIVNACLAAGVRQPSHIRALVREIWDGARQLQQKRPRLGTLDWILNENGAGFGAKTLVRILRNSDCYLVPASPTSEMVDASMATVSDFTARITKRTKHHLRLQAAIKAGVAHIWPDLQ